MLCQTNNDGNETVIAYASRVLRDPERRYHSYEQEMLAVVWAPEHFRYYIGNSQVTIITDCQSFTTLSTGVSKSARVSRWALRMSEFKYTIEHVAGKDNRVPDALSRNPVDRPQDEITRDDDFRPPLMVSVAQSVYQWV